MIEHNTILEDFGVLGTGWRAEIPEHAYFIGSTPVLRDYFLALCTRQNFAIGALCDQARSVSPTILIETHATLSERAKEYANKGINAPLNE